MTTLITSVPTVEFDPPRIASTDRGLFAAITQGNSWVDVGSGANRFSIGGVRIRTINYGGEESSGVWNAPWCGSPDPSNSTKGGDRPAFPDPFEPIVTWAYDSCDEFEQTRAEIRENAQRWLTIHAPIQVERAVATRLLVDGGSPASSTSFLDALGQIEAAIAETGLPGFIHASPALAPYATNLRNVAYRGTELPITTLGTTWVFGGGYGDILGTTLVATSQPYGWKDAPAVTEAMYSPNDSVTASANQFVTLAEQTFAVGFEQVIAAVEVTL